MKILIVEDNDLIQELNLGLMNNWGYEFDIASNGKEAVEYAKQNNGKYDLCLMDIEMPVMNGIEATKKIRQTQMYFPIMGYTSNSNYRAKCLSAGMDEFMQKPCYPKQLFGIISELTSKTLSINTKNNNISIKKVMPMNSDELQELRELKKQGLTKLKLIGVGHAFVVHKNVQNKISHDLIGESKELSEFIDRSPSEPGRCHLYKANLHVTKDIFLPEELEEAIRREDEIASKFSDVADENNA